MTTKSDTSKTKLTNEKQKQKKGKKRGYDVISIISKGDHTPEHMNIMFTYIINLGKGEHLADIRMERCF